jgi:hypothetical protein
VCRTEGWLGTASLTWYNTGIGAIYRVPEGAHEVYDNLAFTSIQSKERTYRVKGAHPPAASTHLCPQEKQGKEIEASDVVNWASI